MAWTHRAWKPVRGWELPRVGTPFLRWPGGSSGYPTSPSEAAVDCWPVSSADRTAPRAISLESLPLSVTIVARAGLDLPPESAGLHGLTALGAVIQRLAELLFQTIQLLREHRLCGVHLLCGYPAAWGAALR